LYAQSLSVALAVYLENRFSLDPMGERSRKRFSQAQVRRLEDYIAVNLASDLALGDLADLVQMSRRQFFRFFSNTFGNTPHQHLLKERVRRAKELLSGGSLPVDITFILGFSNQSHFTEVFKRMTGVSPGRFRQESG